MLHTVTLSPEQSTRVEKLVANGSFHSPAQAVQQLLDAILAATELSDYTPGTLAHLRQGMTEASAGKFASTDEVTSFLEEWRQNG